MELFSRAHAWHQGEGTSVWGQLKTVNEGSVYRPSYINMEMYTQQPKGHPDDQGAWTCPTAMKIPFFQIQISKILKDFQILKDISMDLP